MRYLRDGFHSTSTEDDSATLEHAAISHCIIQLFTSQVLPQDANKLQDLVQSYFPTTHRVPHGSDLPLRKDGIPAVLVEAVQSELSDRHLQCLPALMEKVCAKIVLLSLEACNIQWHYGNSCYTSEYNAVSLVKLQLWTTWCNWGQFFAFLQLYVPFYCR